MLKLRWHLQHITTNAEANQLIEFLKSLDGQILYGAFDTESTGLHIIFDTPFLYQFGFVHPNGTDGYAYSVDIEKQPILSKAVIRIWHSFCKSFKYYMGHNVKFDLHQLINLGIPYDYEDNITDTMFWIRYGHDALTEKHGGPPLGLKPYSARYIDLNAKYHEHKLDQEKSLIAKTYNQQLKILLRNCDSPPEKYGAKSYTLSVLEKMFKDPTIDIDDMESEFKENYLNWLQNIPLPIQRKMTTGLVAKEDIPYNMLNRQNLITYAQYDIVYTLEVFLFTMKLVIARDNLIGVDFENKLIFPLVEMERVGFKADVTYLKESRIRLKNYIKERQQFMYDLTGQEFSIGQHELIKSILYNDFDVDVPSTANENLELKLSELEREGEHEDAVALIKVIQELRTLEKWYSTYVMRFLNQLKNSDRLYTTIHQVGTVSGRVTSDFQQFPKDPIVDINGNELFHPRKIILVSGENYVGTLYLDYSQIELRFQAFYTILVGNPDINLCRAYMPYHCHNDKAEQFDYNNSEHIANAYTQDWYLNENCNKWTPLDVHGATTKVAFNIDETHPDFHRLRYVGKTTNFAKNYGATIKRIRQMFPHYDEEQVKRIDEAYYTAFPGVKAYHNYCYNRAQLFAYTTNLFGIKYYGVSGHNLINILIQGSAAFFLKWKIRELYDYSKTNKIKSRWQMQIHDELSWEVHNDDDPQVFFEFQRIMQDWSDTLVPIVADMEFTTTKWAEKKEVGTIDELQIYFRS